MKTALVQFLDFIGSESGHKRERMKTFKRAREKNLKHLPTAGVDLLFSHDLTFLKETGFYQEFKHLFKYDRLCAYGCWKPYIILDAMNKTDVGDVIFYYDCNYVDFSESSYGSKESLNQIAKMTVEKGHVFHATEYKEKYCTKRDAFILMDCDESTYHETPQVQSTWCSLLNNAQNRKFVKDWLRYSKDIRIITDERNSLDRENYPGFMAHRHDQSIMSLLVKKYKYEYYVHPNKNVWHFLWSLNKNKTQIYK